MIRDALIAIAVLVAVLIIGASGIGEVELALLVAAAIGLFVGLRYLHRDKTVA